MFHLEIDIGSTRPKKEEDEIYYYPQDEAYEDIRKHRSSTPNDKPSCQSEQEHPTPRENDVQQMTVQDNNGHRKTSVEDQTKLVGFVQTSSLPTKAMNNLSPSITGNSHVV